MNYRTFSNLRDVIVEHLPKLQSYQFDLVVGIPRSGMIPAYMISLYLNLRCCDLESLIKDSPLKTGSTRGVKHDIKYPSEAKNILIVDDSIMSGKSLKKEWARIPESLKPQLTTLAIYSSEKVRDDIDIFLEYIPEPRIFEWNIFHHDVVSRSCFDIDGVLCTDPNDDENDDGEKYVNFIHNAPPLFIPSGKIHTIVTSRLEKYRAETETWLRKNGVDYQFLVMLDLPSKEERQRLGAHATHKAKAYQKSGQDLFYESERDQAIKIHELTKKPVYCVGTNEMFANGLIVSAIFGSHHSKRIFLNKIIKMVPGPLYKVLRFLYRSMKRI